MIQPRPIRSCLRSTKQGFDISLSSCFCLHGGAENLWFGVKLAEPSFEGSSGELCRPTLDKGVKHVKCCNWEAGLLFKDKMVTYLRNQRLRSAILN